MELRNTLKNMFLNSIIQDLNLLADKMRDIDKDLLNLSKSQQKDFCRLYCACVEGIEKIEKMKQGT